MVYTQSDFLTQVQTLGFIQATTNAFMSLLPVNEPPVEEPSVEEPPVEEPPVEEPPVEEHPHPSASKGASQWVLDNLKPAKTKS